MKQKQSHFNFKMVLIKHIIFYIIIMLFKIYETFYIPQPYNIKMYHYQSLLITTQNGTQESSVFKLRTSDDRGYSIHHKKASNAKRKRSIIYFQDTVGNTSYNSKSQDQSAIDSMKRNRRNDYDYNKYKSDYYQEEDLENTTSTLPKEYENEEDSEFTTELSLNRTKYDLQPFLDVPMDNYCSVILLLRIRVFECFIYGINTENDNIKMQSGRVLLFWLIMYIVIASYLWCTRGWCCCCCPCAYCHPHDVIYEAKQFLSQNPPGVAKLHSKRQVTYEATDYEKTCYKALENQVFNI